MNNMKKKKRIHDQRFELCARTGDNLVMSEGIRLEKSMGFWSALHIHVHYNMVANGISIHHT